MWWRCNRPIVHRECRLHTALLAGFCLTVFMLLVSDVHKIRLNSKRIHVTNRPDRLKNTRPILPRDHCQPVKRLAYVKTYKTASSRIQNAIFRFADKEKLDVALPATETIFRGSFDERHKTLFKHVLDIRRFDILANHARFKPSLYGLMKENFTLITSIRAPAEQFESIYNYFNLTQELEPIFDWFIEDPWSSYRSMLARSHSFLPKHLTKNANMFMLGLQEQDFENNTKVQQKIKEIDEKFDLVLISERLEESMIMLKHLLCWQTDDVVVLMSNRRTKRTDLDKRTRDMLQQWNKADLLLYNHFSAKFDNLVAQFGKSRMQSEIVELRNRTNFWKEKCLTTNTKGRGVKRLSGKVEKIVLKNHSPQCVRLVWIDNVYTEYFKKKVMEKKYFQKKLNTTMELNKKYHRKRGRQRKAV